MNIRDFSFNLQKVYQEMAETFTGYQASTGLHCLSGCGRCCQNPDVEASVLEMIPLALKIYDEGRLEEWFDRLDKNEQQSCVLFEKETEGKGKCSSYQERPAVCRMFGVAGYFDKHHQVTLSICKYIQEASSELAETKKHSCLGAPVIADWSSKLNSLDPGLLMEKKPINFALRGALEKVAFLAMYQD